MQVTTQAILNDRTIINAVTGSGIYRWIKSRLLQVIILPIIRAQNARPAMRRPLPYSQIYIR